VDVERRPLRVLDVSSQREELLDRRLEALDVAERVEQRQLGTEARGRQLGLEYEAQRRDRVRS